MIIMKVLSISSSISGSSSNFRSSSSITNNHNLNNDLFNNRKKAIHLK